MTLFQRVHMPSLDRAVGWLNSEPLGPADLRGRVVLVNFWTFTCINWLRTLPYVRAWAEKYEADGLVVVGVHTPEFPFEADAENVARMVQKLRVDYPVAIDSRYGIWDEFANSYWPALYLADREGALCFEHFGEGRYEESERAIQDILLTGDRDLVSVEGPGLEAPADWEQLDSPETYLGYGRGERFSSPGGGGPNERRFYSLPETLRLNQWALAGDWTIRQQAVVSEEPGGRLCYRFHARDVHLVIAPPDLDSPVPFRVLLDGEPLGALHGEDTDEEGNGFLSEPRLYQLVRQSGPVVDRTFEITFSESGAAAYAFTFG
jgi:thiol-disulfide isomerase/thioredoxin